MFSLTLRSRRLLRHPTSYRVPRKSLANLRAWSTFSADESSLTLHSLSTTFPYVWLRDSCQSPQCVHPSTSQKLHRSSDISLHIKPTLDGIQLTSDGIRIVWTDGHQSFFHSSFLERHSSPDKLSTFHNDIPKESWNLVGISKSRDLFVSYESLRTPSGLLSGIGQISKYGLLFVSGVPNKETANETCELSTLAQLFGDIRPTFYGRLWDVMNVRNSKNIAYTNLDLGLHMDLLYFEHPPQYQILHCLRNRVVGGTSVFVDGLHAAKTLRGTHPADFDALSTTPVAFHYINDGHHLHQQHPTIELAGPMAAPPDGEIRFVNYSPPFQAPLPLSTPLTFYSALQKFTMLLNDPLNTYQYTLQEGDAVFFDNRRVLHARTAFSDIEGDGAEGEANRWLKGCYLEADAIKDRGRILRTQLGKKA